MLDDGESSVSSDDSSDSDESYDYHVEDRKLSAIYQFALAMPLLFVPASHNKTEERNERGMV